MTLQQWSRYSLATQLANIFVELGRAERLKQSVDRDSRDLSIGRALELADLTLEAHTGFTQRRELARLREIIADNLTGARTHHIPLEQLRTILQPAILWVARERGVA